jgi:uncharacterized protein YecE (DUF72 family)
LGKIKAGTCGYEWYGPPKGWKKKFDSKLQAYADVFQVVELNRTFYKLPMVKTVAVTSLVFFKRLSRGLPRV